MPTTTPPMLTYATLTATDIYDLIQIGRGIFPLQPAMTSE
jgi:hypothetical protein